MGRKQEDEATRRAIRAILNGDEVEGIAHKTYGRWWELVATLRLELAREGVARVRFFCRGVAARLPEARALMEGLPIEEPPMPVGAEALLRSESRGLRWAVPGLVPEGLTILAGAPKLGKSWLCLDLAIAVASGGIALGAIRVEAGDVLYLALEDTQRRLRERLSKLLQDGKVLTRLHFTSNDQHLERWDRGGKSHLEAWLNAHPEARLVIVDTLAKFRPQQAGGRGAYDQDYRSVQEMLALAGARRIGLLLAHHTRKATSEDALGAISGSFGLSGGVDGVLVLRRERGQADATLHVTGRDVHEQELALMWDEAATRWRIVGEAAEFRGSQTRLAILQALRHEKRPMTPQEVWETVAAQGLNVSYSAVKQCMYRMSKQGLVRTSGGMYRPAGETRWGGQEHR